MAGRESLPSPGELAEWNRPSLLYRLRILGGAMQSNAKVRFFALFLLFVFSGAVIMMLLEGGSEGSPFRDLFKSLWFTVVTITTVGYGDISPDSIPARIWAMIEMLVGIGLVGIITGSMASWLVESNRKQALGLVPVRNLRNHIVVCGWKQDIRNILVELLESNRWLTAYDLVLVTTQHPTEVGELRREPALRGLHFVFGSHTDRSVLIMARVDQAERVIILADESGRGGRGDTDSRTVLSATAVEAISQVVYTCTEIVHPHFIPYLRPAGVEEVVLSEVNAVSLLSAASLGDGLSGVMSRFLPMSGMQFRVLDIPRTMRGRSYGNMAEEARAKGYLPIGLLAHTGRLHDRKGDLIREALKQPTYRDKVDSLRNATNLVSNTPNFYPHPETVIGPHGKLMVLMPSPARQTADIAERRRHQQPHGRFEPDEHLLICGWKQGMARLVLGILAAHKTAGKKLKRITVVSRMPLGEAEVFAKERKLRRVTLVDGDPTDPMVLRRLDVETASRALVLTNPVHERNAQEADAQNVMISFAINELNPSTYKCVELINPSFSEHLRIASVEEVIHTQAYQRTMLVQAALGTGLSSAVGALIHPEAPVLQVRAFPKLPPGTPFSRHAERFAEQGLLLVGSIEHSGNDHTRRRDYLHMAQSQPAIATAIDRLLALKKIQGNDALLNPSPDFLPGSESLAVVIAPSILHAEGP